MENSDLNPITKIYAVMQIVPEELEKDIVRLGQNLKSYEDVKNYIVEQDSIRRDVKNATKGPVPMEHQLAKLIASMTGD